jgi:hypothetical protein
MYRTGVDQLWNLISSRREYVYVEASNLAYQNREYL